jgi:hypothetical protein
MALRSVKMNKENEVNKMKLFFKCIGLLVGILMLLAIVIAGIHYEWNIFISVAVIILYCVAINQYLEVTMGLLWDYLCCDRKAHKLTATLGTIDRIIYSICFVLGEYGAIGVWFGIKIATRLISYSTVSDSEGFKDEGERKNIYLLGNAISLLLGISVGFCIKMLFSIYYPDLLGPFVEKLKNGWQV